MRNTYISGLRAALKIAEDRAVSCRNEERRHREGAPNFTPDQNAMWERFERQCAMEAECIAGAIRRLIDTARADLRREGAGRADGAAPEIDAESMVMTGRNNNMADTNCTIRLLKSRMTKLGE